MNLIMKSSLDVTERNGEVHLLLVPAVSLTLNLGNYKQSQSCLVKSSMTMQVSESSIHRHLNEQVIVRSQRKQLWCESANFISSTFNYITSLLRAVRDLRKKRPPEL
jgi:hypothetical protein